MASPNHTTVAVQPVYSPAGGYPVTYGAAPVVIGQSSQQHHASSPKKLNSNYSRVSSILFGFIHIALCIVSITGAIYAVANGDEYGTGFWCGIIYASVGCMAAAAGWYTTKSMIITVAVFSFLDIPFGISAIVLASNGLMDSGECDASACFVEDMYATAGHAMVWATGFWGIVFGLCLLIISIRAICIGSKPQVASFPVYYTSTAPETVQLNTTTSMHAYVTYPTTINGVQQTHQSTTVENQYEGLDVHRF